MMKLVNAIEKIITIEGHIAENNYFLLFGRKRNILMILIITYVMTNGVACLIHRSDVYFLLARPILLLLLSRFIEVQCIRIRGEIIAWGATQKILNTFDIV